MFNILLIVAGVLVYILLGIDFKVQLYSCVSMACVTTFSLTEQLCEHLSWGDPDWGGVSKCFHRLVPSPKVRGHLSVFSCHDPRVLPCHTGFIASDHSSV